MMYCGHSKCFFMEQAKNVFFSTRITDFRLFTDLLTVPLLCVQSVYCHQHLSMLVYLSSGVSLSHARLIVTD